MGKNKARHLLHGILDLLPLFVIPIFAIYTRNENYNSNIEIQVEENIEVDFNQKGNFKNSTNFTSELSTITTTISNAYYPGFVDGTFENNHIYVLRPSVIEGDFQYIQAYYNTTNTLIKTFNDNESYMFTFNSTSGLNIYLNLRANIGDKLYFNVFDLTQMYGSGNEPSLSKFLLDYPNNTYAYTMSHKELLENQTITYNDTDVGSQFVYTLYNTVDKYFNMGNVFNMNDVYDWFALNIFGGNASMSVYIVWNIVLYEFVMDLLFLLYGLFMFFIDMCKRLMEKPLNSIK